MERVDPYVFLPLAISVYYRVRDAKDRDGVSSSDGLWKPSVKSLLGISFTSVVLAVRTMGLTEFFFHLLRGGDYPRGMSGRKHGPQS